MTAASRRAWVARRGAARCCSGRVSVGWLTRTRSRARKPPLRRGQVRRRRRHYNQALVDDPDSPRLHFNLGDARYKAGKFDDALAAFGQVPGGDADAGRSARLAYNVGNTKFRQGEAAEAKEPQKTLELWADALVAYRHALGANPDDVDAKFNHELVEKNIAALKKKLEQQKQQQKQQDQQGIGGVLVRGSWGTPAGLCGRLRRAWFPPAAWCGCEAERRRCATVHGSTRCPEWYSL